MKKKKNDSGKYDNPINPDAYVIAYNAFLFVSMNMIKKEDRLWMMRRIERANR